MLFTNSEHVGGQTHSIPMLLSFKAAILSGGFKLENTSVNFARKNKITHNIKQLQNKRLNVQIQCQNAYVDYHANTLHHVMNTVDISLNMPSYLIAKQRNKNRKICNESHTCVLQGMQLILLDSG